MKNVLQTLAKIICIILISWDVSYAQVTFAVSPDSTDTTTGSNVCLDVTVAGFTDLIAMQYSMNYDPAVLEFTGAQNFNLSNFNNSNIGNPSPGALTISWLSDDLANGTSVSDLTSIYQVCFDVIGGSMTESDIDFTGSPTPIEIADATGATLSLIGESGIVTVDGGAGSGGGGGGAFPNLTVEISDDTANTGDNICLPILVHNFDSIVSLQYSINYDDSHLSYTGNQNLNLANLNASNIGNPSAGNITFSWLTDDFVDGTTVADGTAIFDLCFDVTGSDVTSTLDVSGTPTAIEASNAAGNTIPLDGETGTVIIGSGGGGGGGPVYTDFTIEIEDLNVDAGQNICVPVLVHLFDSIVSAQFSINYDETVLEYTGAANLNLANLNASNIGNPGAGDITFSWLTDDFANGTTVADGTAIFELCFDAIGNDGDVSVMDVSGTPTSIEVSDVFGATITVNEVDGSVTINDNGGGGGGPVYTDFTIEIEDLNVDAGQNICVPVLVHLFDSIVSAQFSINYDETVLEYTGAANLNLANLNASNIGNPGAGDITFSWLTDDFVNGTTVADGTAIFELCFDAVGNDGDVSVMDVSGTPTSIEVSDVSGATITVNEVDGSVTINDNGGGGGGPVYTDFTIEIEDLNVDAGQNICVPVMVHLFNGIVSAQFSINYDPAILSYTGAANLNLANLNAANIGNPGAGDITFSWLTDDFVNGTTVADGTAIFELCFDAVGNDGDVSVMDVSGTPTSIEVSDVSGATITVNEVDGSVTINDNGGGGGGPVYTDFTIEIEDLNVDAGQNICVPVMVHLFNGIVSAQFSINYDPAILSYTGAANLNLANLNAANIGNPGAGDITFSWLTDDFANGTTVADGTAIFELCFDAIGNDGDVSVMDVSGTPTSIEVSDVSGATITVNEVDGSVTINDNGGGGGGPVYTDFTIEIEDLNVDAGQNICVPVMVHLFNGIVSAQFSINYDPAILSYTGASNLNLANLTAANIGNPGAGDITFSWLTDDFANGTTVADGTAIFELCFDAIGNDGDVSVMDVSGDPTVIEVSDITGSTITVNEVDGSVTINDNGGGGGGGPVYTDFTIEIDDLSVDAGQNICVPVMVHLFNGIVSAQFSINYDETVLEYTGASNLNLANLTASNIGNPGAGDITFSWLTDDFANGTTVADGTAIFELCFDAIGNDGDVSVMDVSGDPTVIEVSDITGSTITVNEVDGSVTINDNGGGGGGGPVYTDFTIEIDDLSVDAGQNICVPVMVHLFNGIVSAQFSINYDETVLEYTGASNLNLANLTAANIGNPGAGDITFSWLTDDFANGTTVADGTAIFELCFDAIGNDGDVSVMDVSGDPTVIEVSDITGSTITVNEVDGSVTINDNGGGGGGGPVYTDFTIEIDDLSVDAGQNICVPVMVHLFNGIVSAQFSINYDPAILSYTGASNLNLANLTAANIGNPGAGDITFSWLTDDFANGTTVADGTAIFELCFDAIGNDSDVSVMDVSGDPTLIEVSDITGSTITVNEVDGSVTINDNGGGGGGGPFTDFTIEIQDLNVDAGQNICVPVLVHLFDGIVSAQFSINYDPAILSYTGASNLNLANLNASNIGNPGAGDITFSWLTDDFANGTTVADGTAIFELCFDAIGNDSDVSVMDVSGDPTLIEVSDITGSTITVNEVDGSVTINDNGGGGGGGPFTDFTIEIQDLNVDAGQNICVPVLVHLFDGIVSAQFSINYDPAILSYTGAANLNLANLNASNIGNPGAGDITFSWLTDDFANGTTVADGTAIFELCFDAIGNDGDVSVMDISGDPTTIEVSDISGATITVNEVDGSVTINDNGGGGGGGPFTDFTIEIQDLNVDAGQNICVPVLVHLFDGIVSAQFSINYDPAILSYTGAANLNLANLNASNIGNPTAGDITFSWLTDDFANGTTVADGTAIFELCFDAIGNDGDVSVMDISGDPTTIEVSDISGATITVNDEDGSVTINDNGGGGGGGPFTDFTIEIQDLSVEAGDNICVPVLVHLFDGIVSAQFSINYDPAILSYTGAANLNLANLNASNIGNPTAGDITFSWLTDDFANGTTVADGTAIFELCFDAIGNDGDVSVMDVSGDPTTIEVSDISGATITVNDEDGSVTINDDGGPGPSMIELTASEHFVPQGDPVCVSITSEAFTGLTDLSFDLEYDATIIEFVSVQNIQLVGLSASDITNPMAGLIQVDYSNTPTNFGGGVLFDICFTAIGGVGETSDIIFSNTSATDAQGAATVTTNNGFVQIDTNIDGFALILTDENTQNGENFCMDLLVNDFIDINSMQFTIEYDPTMMTLTGMNPINLPGFSNQNINNPSPGIITLSWEAMDPTTGETMLNGVSILELCFDAIGPDCSTTDVEIVNQPTLIEILDVDFNFLTLQQFGGLVNICHLQPLTIEVDELMVSPAAMECLEVTVDGFEGLSSMQWELDYDQTVISNITIENFGLDGLDNNSFGLTPGMIALSWVGTDLVNGTTVPDGTVIFEICFDAVGFVGDFTPVEFDTDAPIEIADPNFNVLDPSLLTLIDGSVEIVIACPDIIVDAAIGGSCIDEATGSIDLEVSGGDDTFTFEWSNGELTEDLSGLAPGSYTVTVYSCGQAGSVELTFEVEGYEPPVVDSETVEHVLCHGEATGSISLDVSNTDAILWSGPNMFSDTSSTITNLVAGTYTAELTNNNGCVSTHDVEVLEPASGLETSGVVTSNTGMMNGSIDLTVIGGTPDYMYSWEGSNGEIFDTEDITGLLGGTYIVTVTDANGCTALDTFEVPVPIEVNIIDFANICADFDGNITAEIIGGVDPITIEWSLDGVVIPGADQLTIDVTEAGIYEITVVDALGNTDSTQIEILANSTPIEADSFTSATNGIACDGSALIVPFGGTATVTTDYIIEWSNGETGQLITDLCPGIYNVTVTDLIGCSAVFTFEIPCGQPPLAVAMINTTEIACNGDESGTVSVTLDGGAAPFYIELLNSAGDTLQSTSSTQHTFAIQNLGAGDYVLAITDSSPCEDQTLDLSFTITEPEPLVATIESVLPATCPAENGAADISVTGGTPIYQYYWEFPGASTNVQDPTGVAAGIYDLSIIDANGCTYIFEDFLEIECFQIANLSGTSPNCAPDSTGTITIEVTGQGMTGLTYIVKDADGNIVAESDSPDIAGLPEGMYFVEVIDADGNITAQQAINIEALSHIEGSYEVISDYNGFANPCPDDELGIIDLSAQQGSGAYTFSTCDGQILSNTTIEELASGEYCYLVADTLGCTVSIDVVVDSPEPISATTMVTALDCSEDSDAMVTLEVTGGYGEYMYQWDAAAFNQQTNPAMNLTAGMYSVEIIDDNNCNVELSVEVEELEPLSLDFVLVPSFTGDCTGAIAAEVIGGTAPYTYEWSVDGEDYVLSDLCPGDYDVTVIDANGCEISGSAEVRNENDQCLSYRNVISPNGDKYNEEFYLHCVEDFDDTYLEIFNRWGRLVYQTADYDNTWRGTDQSGAIDLPEGGYFFVFKYREQGATELSQLKGHITIIRE